MVEKGRPIFSTVLSVWHHSMDRILGTSLEIASPLLEPRSEVNADEGEGDTWCSCPSGVEQRAEQLIMCLFVGYVYLALTLCWASGGVEMKSCLYTVQRQKGTQ